MSGVAIARALLAAWTPLTALVPTSRIIAGQIPEGTPRPAIGVRTIDDFELRTVARRLANRTVRERVQVTVLADSYADQKKILKACGMGPGMKTGTVLGYKVRSVEPAGAGPDIPPGNDGIYEQSRDFMVTFIEPS